MEPRPPDPPRVGLTSEGSSGMLCVGVWGVVSWCVGMWSPGVEVWSPGVEGVVFVLTECTSS